MNINDDRGYKKLSNIKYVAQIIESVYQAFSSYKVNREIEGCPYCMTFEEMNKLCSKKLKCLLEEELYVYLPNAMCTCGNVTDFKYFLPRLLELEIFQKHGYPYLSSTLSNAKFSIWPAVEREVVKTFLKEYFICCLNNEEFYNAFNILDECKELIPGFIESNIDIKNYIMHRFYCSIDYKKCSNASLIEEFFQVLIAMFGEKFEEECINSWPENENGVLTFSVVANINNYIFTDAIRFKFEVMKKLLEDYWYINQDIENTQIVENILLAIKNIEYYLDLYNKKANVK